MTITFADFEYGDNGQHTLELNADLLGELTGQDADKLSGLLGGGTIGTVKIGRDEYASLEDDLGDGAGDGEAVGPTREAERKWRIPAVEDSSDPNVEKILAARTRLQDRYEDTDDYGQYGYKVLQRYARLLGCRYELDQLQSSNDFASVYTITPADREKNSTVEEYKEIFEGNVFYVDVEVHSPIRGGEPFSTSISGCIGEAYTLELAGEVLVGLVDAIRQQVREMRNG